MRRAALLTVVVAMAACGGATRERLSPGETLSGVDLPAIGSVGDFPDTEHRHVVNVTADGRIAADGRELSFEELSAAMKRWSALSSAWYCELGDPVAGPTGEGSLRLSGEDLLLRIDRHLPLAATFAIIEAAGEARMFRIWFAVRHEADGAEGAIGYPATLEGGRMDMGGSLRLGLPTSIVTATAHPSDGSPQRLFEVLRAMREAGPARFEVYLDHDPSLPTGTWLGLWDAVVRARVAGVRFGGERSRKSVPFAAAVGLPRSEQPTYSITLFGLSPPNAIDTSPMPAVARIKGPAQTIEAWSYEPTDGPATVLTAPLPK